ncbi:MAG: preprotein translocase subunit SecA, partial [Planctomycetota bacterium]
MSFLDNISVSVGKSLKKVFGDSNTRALKAIEPTVQRINELESSMQSLTDEQLRAKTPEFKQRLEQGATLDDLLPEAFAAVREVGKRTMGMRHFDVQLIGGVVLHQGKIAEMTTGEGKTLVATLPTYLNALAGRGVHVVTVNDYLARRDAEWMSPIYQGLGLTVGSIQGGMDSQERLPIYGCDITYGTNNEFGFDYLRDNMKVRAEHQVQKDRYFAIVDEVDSILIDEARTPLIISGMPTGSTEKYYLADNIARKLKKDEHFEIKEKEHAAVFTEEGIERAEQLAGVDSFYTGANMDWPHHIEQALKAHFLYSRDKEYVVQDNEIIIVDEFTGRLMPGRRWSDGLHQTVESKERIKAREELQTLATITLQNYFKLYEKLAGMTGTAQTEAAEFYQIYKLDVMSIPTNRELKRQSYPDIVYRTKREKIKALLDEIQETHEAGRPSLVGTIAIEDSEQLSDLLKRRGIPHDVLNAKQHEREAHIIAQAGRKGAVTIATNMAGRGT